MPSSGIWQTEASPEIWRRAPGRLGKLKKNAAEEEYDDAGAEARVSGGSKALWLIPLFLSVVSVVMIASLTSGRSSGPFYGAALKQLRYAGAGILLMGFCYFCVPIRFIRKFSFIFWIAAMVLTSLTLMPGVGVRAGGAIRWVKLGPITFQPLEVMIFVLPLFLADRLVLSKREKFQGFLRPTLFLAIISIFFIRQHMGGILLVFSICLSTHWIVKGWKYPVVTALVLVLVFYYVLIPIAPYRMRRYEVFANPWSDPQDKGYQIIQGLVAFSNGGLTGVGIGKGLQKSKFLPAAHTDYIFSSIGEEFGLTGTILVVGFYGMWAYKALQLYKRSKDPYTAALIWGMTASILFPMFVNLGGVIHIMPLTGIPLPFLSAGGSAMICMWLKVGVLTRVAKEIAQAEQAENA